MLLTVKYFPSILTKSGRITRQVEVAPGTCLQAVLSDRWHSEHRVIHSRRGAVPKADWGSFVLEPGDEVIVTPELAGGGGGGSGNLLKGIAKLAVSFFGFGGPISPLVGIAGFQSGSKDLMSFVSPNIKPALANVGQGANGGGNQDLGSSATYAWDGIKSQADQGIPVPIIYGKHRVGGNFINAYVTQDGEKSYLNVLIALGEGKLHKVAGFDHAEDNADIDDIGDKILVEGNPISNFRDAKVYVRVGEDDQSRIPGFSQVHDSYAIEGVKLQKNEAYVRSTRNSDCEGLIVTFRHRSLASFDKGQTKSATYKAKIYYKPFGADDDEYELAGTYSKTAKTVSEVRGQFEIEDLPMGRYDIKVVQTSSNSQTDKLAADTDLFAFDEIRDDKLTYPRTALLGLKVLATSQISGSLSDVSVEVEGLKPRVYSSPSSSTKQYSNNPIWCVNDLLTNKVYGLGRHNGSVITKIERSIEEADYCDEEVDSLDGTDEEKRFKLDVVIDAETSALDALLALCSTFRGILIWESGKISVIVEKPEPVTQLFTMGNIIKGSFESGFQPWKERPNLIEVSFLNHNNDFKREIVAVENEESIAAGDSIVKRSLFLRGVTREGQAVRVGWWLMQSERELPRDVRFRAGIDAVTCLPGDVVGVSHDVPQWGISSGRVGPGSGSTTIKLNRSVTLAELPSGEVYLIQVQHANGHKETKNIASPAGDYPAGTAISVSSAWDHAPLEYDLYSIGKVEPKPFRVTSMKVRENFEVEISGREYDEAVYSDTPIDVDPTNYTELPDPTLAPAQVTGVAAKADRSYEPEVVVSWNVSDQSADYGFYDKAEVQVSKDQGATYEPWGQFEGTSGVLLGLEPAVTYKLRVVAISTRGRRATEAAAPVIEFTPLPALPPVVTGLELKGQGNNTEFKGRDAEFTWREATSSTAVHPAGEEPNGAGTGARDKHIRGYRVKIRTGYLDGLIGFPGNYEHDQLIYENRFTYSAALNFKENGNTLKREFTILVWAEDIYGQLSPRPATLTVSNPPAAAVEDLVALKGRYNTEDPPPDGVINQFASIGWTENPDYDIVGYVVYMSYVAGLDNPPTNATKDSGDYYPIFFGNATLVQANPPDGSASFPPVAISVFVAPMDAFSFSNRTIDDLNWSSAVLDFP